MNEFVEYENRITILNDYRIYLVRSCQALGQGRISEYEQRLFKLL